MRRCCECGAYLDAGERCDCGSDQSLEIPRVRGVKHRRRKAVKMHDEASMTGVNYTTEQYINDCWQRWYEC